MEKKKKLSKKNQSHWTPKKIKTIILSLAIAIVLTSFVIFLIESIYPSPKWEDYCGKVYTPRAISEDKGLLGESCSTVSPDYRDECCVNKGYAGYDSGLGECEGDLYQKCQKEYNDEIDKHRLVAFIVSVIVGVIAISTGILLQLLSVSSGLMLGGTFLMIYGTGGYWSNLSNWLRAIILGIVLFILIWLAYRKLEN